MQAFRAIVVALLTTTLAYAFPVWRCDKPNSLIEKRGFPQLDAPFEQRRAQEQQERDNLEAMKMLMKLADRLHERAHGKEKR